MFSFKNKIIIFLCLTVLGMVSVFAQDNDATDEAEIEQMISILPKHSQNDVQFEIGVKNISNTFVGAAMSNSNYSSLYHNFEIFGRIPVKSKFSINVAAGFGQHEINPKDSAGEIEGYQGFFFKTGLNKAFGRKRTRFLLGINAVFSSTQNNQFFEYQDDLDLWEPHYFALSERKNTGALEIDLGYEVHLGKSWYIGSSIIMNSGFNAESSELENYRHNYMAGISGLLGQEGFRINMVNFSYKFR